MFVYLCVCGHVCEIDVEDCRRAECVVVVVVVVVVCVCVCVWSVSPVCN